MFIIYPEKLLCSCCFVSHSFAWVNILRNLRLYTSLKYSYNVNQWIKVDDSNAYLWDSKVNEPKQNFIIEGFYLLCVSIKGLYASNTWEHVYTVLYSLNILKNFMIILRSEIIHWYSKCQSGLETKSDQNIRCDRWGIFIHWCIFTLDIVFKYEYTLKIILLSVIFHIHFLSHIACFSCFFYLHALIYFLVWDEMID